MKTGISKQVGVVLLAILLFLLSCASPPEKRKIQDFKSVNQDLDKAIATLRHLIPDHVVPDGLSAAEREAKSKEIDKAWETIKASGKEGVSRLKEEVKKTEPKKENFFKLNAARFLWMVGRFDETESIVEIWDAASLSYHYHYVFYTAFEAAKTQDERALPLLKATLKENRGVVQTAHMPIRSPLTHEFTWGSYGPKGLPVLLDVLKTSKDPVEIDATGYILLGALYLDALPIMRELAAGRNEQIRRVAIMSLGIYGHPQDYDFLVSGLRSKDPKELWAYVYALVEYGDLRAAPHVIPLLATEDSTLKHEVIFALYSLLTRESFEALKKHSDTAKDQKDAETCKERVNDVLKKLNLTWNEYLEIPQDEKERLTRTFHKMMSDETFASKKGERSLSHDEFVQAANQWKEYHRLDNWVKARHLTSVATANDINLLLELKASVLMRLSDECLYETKEIDHAVFYLGRSRYRKDPGKTEKVKAP
jgi:HEAT repeat protein